MIVYKAASRIRLRSVGELQRIYSDFCNKLLGGNFERKHSTGVLAGYLLSYMEEHYGLTYDKDLFFVDYQPIGSNIRPDVTVISRKGSS